MDQSRLSKWLKTVIIGTGICGIVIYFFVFPYLGHDIIGSNPEFSSWYWPWLIFLWVTAIPCYVALVCGWKVADEISKDNSFCVKNARRLRLISIMAAADSAFVFIGNIVFLLLNMNHPGVILIALFIVFAGIVITVVSAALSHLVLKAAKLREENEFTI
jgi:hypothetical protein